MFSADLGDRRNKRAATIQLLQDPLCPVWDTKARIGFELSDDTGIRAQEKRPASCRAQKWDFLSPFHLQPGEL